MNKTYTTPVGLTSQFSFCGLPFRLDTYAGCSLNCTYCFARLRGGNSNTIKIRVADYDSIVSKFKNAIQKPKSSSGVISEFIRQRVPVHFGGMSDPFQPIENKKKISILILKYLCEINYPIVISTKSILLSEPEYLEALLSNPNIVVQYSFSTLNDQVSEIVEPQANRPSELMQSLCKLVSSGIKTTVRWQPYIPHVSESPSEFISIISGLGIDHVGFEHLKLPVEVYNPLWKKLSSNLDFDIKSYYISNNAHSDGRELILPAEYKIKNALLVKSELKKRNMTFGSADNEIQYLSDNNCCCSGVDKYPGFENWYKYQIAYAIKKSNGNFITLSLIENEWRPHGSIDKYLNSESRITNNSDLHNKVEDYILNRWENLSSPFNPTKFYGVKYSENRDSSGYRIYEWNPNVKNILS